MDELLNCGVESFESMLKENSNTKTAFRSITDVIEETSKVFEEENKGTFKSAIRESNVVVPS